MNAPATPPPTPADVAAIAEAGQSAAAAAPAGTTPEQMETIVRNAIQKEAANRPAFTEEDAKVIADASAAATIAQLQAHGAFEPQPVETTPAPEAGGTTPAPGTPAAPGPDETPHKKTLAERYLR